MAKERNPSGKRKLFGFQTVELPRLTTPNPLAVFGPPATKRPTQGAVRAPSEVGRKVVLEPLFTESPYDLSYACLLIPRFGGHRLRGDVVPFLREMMYSICTSFSWQLDHVVIRPEFLQYVISAPASVPPAKSVRIIREMTSKRILDDYPHYREQNMGGDFWAAPYLVVFGSKPHEPETIVEFIRVTRQGQGFSPQRG